MISFCLKASMEMERTKETWTPRPRCVPAHVRQMNVENLGDAYTNIIGQLGGRAATPAERWTGLGSILPTGAMALHSRSTCHCLHPPSFGFVEAAKVPVSPWTAQGGGYE